MKNNKDIIVLTGAGQLGMAIVRRMGYGNKIFIADWKLENAQAIAKTLTEAGFELRQPGCSACLAMNDDKVPAGKYAVSTSNRNFEGRQGKGGRTHLVSPLVAAATAIRGTLSSPADL